MAYTIDLESFLMQNKKTYLAVAGYIITTVCAYLGIGDPFLVDAIHNLFLGAAIAFVRAGVSKAQTAINEQLAKVPE